MPTISINVDELRRCARLGLTPKQTAELCGCRVESVYRLRDQHGLKFAKGNSIARKALFEAEPWRVQRQLAHMNAARGDRPLTDAYKAERRRITIAQGCFAAAPGDAARYERRAASLLHRHRAAEVAAARAQRKALVALFGQVGVYEK